MPWVRRSAGRSRATTTRSRRRSTPTSTDSSSANATKVATLVGFDGGQVAGPAIEEHLASIFADHRTVGEVRPLADEVVLLRARVGMVPPGQSDVNPQTNAVQSLIAVRDGDAWRVTLFQNTPAQYQGRPDLAEAHTAEMRRALGR